MLTIQLAVLGLASCLVSLVSATALTYKVLPNEKACFFSNVEQQGAKIAFYFAVSFSVKDLAFHVDLLRVLRVLTCIWLRRCNLAAPSI